MLTVYTEYKYNFHSFLFQLSDQDADLHYSNTHIGFGK